MSKKAGGSGRGKPSADGAAVAAPPDRSAVELLGFDEILGQPRAISTLARSLASERVHHAWMFHGPAGVGKFTAACALAATLLDPSATRDLAGALAFDPAGETARLMRSGAHPDFHVVTKDLAAFSRDASIRLRKRTTIPVEVLREFLIEPAAKTASLAREGSAGMASKVMILDEAHLLQPAGQNVLLKTLEEPPPGTVIILITTSEERLLPTVRSRCQRVVFQRLDSRAMDAWAMRRAQQGSAEGIEPLLAIADGSPGEVIRLRRLGAGTWAEQLRGAFDALAAGRADPMMGAIVAKIADEAAARDVEGDRHASKDAANKQAMQEVIRFTGMWVRTRLRSAQDTGAMLMWADASEGLVEVERALASNVQIPLVAARLASVLEGALLRLRG